MSEIKDVSDTAFWVATYRADETKRADALFQDPFAEKLAGEKGMAIASKSHGTDYVRWSLAIRTVVIDNYILKLISEGIDTVINLGAGLDARPYRMKLPASLKWIEADYPHMIEYKNKILAGEKTTCQLTRISVDLANDQERKNFLSKMGGEHEKVLILTEGVVPYLSVNQVGQLADELRAQKSFQFWILDYFSPRVMEFFNKDKRRKEKMKNAPFLFNPPNYFQFFKSHGWNLKEMRYLAEESMRLGRGLPTPGWQKILMFIPWMLMSKEKKKSFLQFVGYAIMEPQ